MRKRIQTRNQQDMKMVGHQGPSETTTLGFNHQFTKVLKEFILVRLVPEYGASCHTTTNHMMENPCVIQSRMPGN